MCLESSATLQVEFGPVASFAPWRQALSQSAIGQTLECGIDPTEAERFFHNFNVGQSEWHGSARPVAYHPAASGSIVVMKEPFAELASEGECE